MSRSSIRREIERVRDEVKDDVDEAMGTKGLQRLSGEYETVGEVAASRARQVIRSHGRVWQENLINSFYIAGSSPWSGMSRRYTFANHSRYAGAHNDGATFDAPPPPENLMPWVLDHMYVFETDSAYEAANNLSFHLFQNGLEGINFMEAARLYLNSRDAARDLARRVNNL